MSLARANTTAPKLSKERKPFSKLIKLVNLLVNSRCCIPHRGLQQLYAQRWEYSTVSIDRLSKLLSNKQPINVD
jgi:hypothetical protein